MSTYGADALFCQSPWWFASVCQIFRAIVLLIIEALRSSLPKIKSMIRLGITDDRPEIRKNLEKIISQFTGIELVFSASDGEDALLQMQSQDQKVVDVILMDIEMRKMDGITATRKIKAIRPEVAIIMLSIFEEEERIFAAIQAGAQGYLLKDERPDQIAKAIRDAHDGRMPMSPLVATKTLKLLQQGSTEKPKDDPASFGLSKREIEILQPLSKGKTYTAIAEQLFISPNTVRSHIENIYKKLAVNSKVEATNLVVRKKWFW